MNNSFKTINIIVGWLVFGIALFVYGSTAETTASLWDCGEFISGAFKLQVVHPPGAPLFLILGRVFTLFAGDDVTKVAWMMNIFSATATAAAIMFLFWIITGIAKRLLSPNKAEIDLGSMIAIIGSGLVGALACTFSDTMWFSAVEGEVYALSMFFISIVFWAVMRWESAVDEDPRANIWIVFAAFMIGLSIGVHLLSLLVIPIAVIIYYLKKYEFSWKGFILSGFVGLVILGLVQVGVIQIVTKIAGNAELFFVNSLGLPFNTGLAFTYIVVFGLLIFGIYKSHQLNHGGLNLACVSFLVIFLGFSTYAMVPIRAKANLPINMNDPSDAFSILSYLNREQYGDRPLVKGPLYTAKPINRKETGNVYYPDKTTKKYEVKGKKQDVEYAEGDKVLFPRMGPTNDGDNAAPLYQFWTGVTGEPTMADNLKYFFKYQVGYMYLRYFMWNFAGRQDDYQGTPENAGINGNWLTGISFIDNMHLGSQDNLPPQIAKAKARNKFYLLPLILGIIGFVFLYQNNKNRAIGTGLLFLMTGMFLIIYTNSPPREPRERDYVLVGSFYTFCIWIGLAVAAIYHFLREKLNGSISAIVALAACLFVPYVMAKNGWDDHNRSGRTMARDFARNYLESCPPNALLITAGDNDTYPLWYAQEVEGIRTDIRIVNTSLLQIDWYIDYLHRAANKSKPLPFIDKFTPDTYRGDTRNFISYLQGSGIAAGTPIDVKRVCEFMLSNDQNNMATSSDGSSVNYLPTRTFKLPVNKESVLKNNVVPDNLKDRIADEIVWSIGGEYLVKNDIALLMIIASGDWSRPICFANTVPPDSYLGLQKYLIQEGLVYRFVPILFEQNQQGAIATNSDKYYDLVMNKFTFGGLDKKEMFVDENSARIGNVLRGSMIRLADDLSRKNAKDSVKQVLNKVIASFKYENMQYYSPYNNMFNMYNLQMTEIYLRSLGYAEGKKFIDKLLDDMKVCYNFYNQPNNTFALQFQNEKTAIEDYVSRMGQMGGVYKQDEFLEKLKKEFPQLTSQSNTIQNTPITQ
jgi:hypothetical protein